MPSPDHYCDVFDRLERENVRYVVISGVAVVLHGHVRPVSDLDLAVDGAPDEARRAMLTLTSAGFVPTVPLPLSALSMARMFDGRGREIDLFVRYYVPFEDLWSSSLTVRVKESTVRVASLEHLIRVKRILARPHDLEDIKGLLALSSPDADPAR